MRCGTVSIEEPSQVKPPQLLKRTRSASFHPNQAPTKERRLVSAVLGQKRTAATDQLKAELYSVRPLGNREPGDQMDFLEDFILNHLAHRIGVQVLRLLSGGRFRGENGFAWGWAVVVGALILFAPLVAFITWLIHRSAH